MIIHIRKANKDAVLLKFPHFTDILWCKARQIISLCFERYYSDGQYRDEFELDLPKGCKKIVIRLMYKSVSWDTSNSWPRKSKRMTGAKDFTTLGQRQTSVSRLLWQRSRKLLSSDGAKKASVRAKDFC